MLFSNSGFVHFFRFNVFDPLVEEFLPIVFLKRVQGVFLFDVRRDFVAIQLGAIRRELPVNDAEVHSHRTYPEAFAASNAAARRMKRSRKVEELNIAFLDARIHVARLAVFRKARFAVAQRAYVSARVTADALGDLPGEVFPPLIRGHLLELLQPLPFGFPLRAGFITYHLVEDFRRMMRAVVAVLDEEVSFLQGFRFAPR
jgi:hypothetical protein